MKHTILSIINDAIYAKSTLQFDAYIFRIQGLIGTTDGFNASQFFSKYLTGLRFEQVWLDMSLEERRSVLFEYADYELKSLQKNG